MCLSMVLPNIVNQTYDWVGPESIGLVLYTSGLASLWPGFLFREIGLGSKFTPKGEIKNLSEDCYLEPS
jgi:hypothetical protein